MFIYIYIYIYIYVCVCVCICIYVCIYTGKRPVSDEDGEVLEGEVRIEGVYAFGTQHMYITNYRYVVPRIRQDISGSDRARAKARRRWKVKSESKETPNVRTCQMHVKYTYMVHALRRTPACRVTKYVYIVPNIRIWFGVKG